MPNPEDIKPDYHRFPGWGERVDSMRGVGDLVAKVATPIARILGLDCIDPKTNDLKPTSTCAQRKAAMNAAIPFQRS